MEVPAPDELDLGLTVRGFSAGQKVFQRYSLVRILGRGGMGVVWLARDGELDRHVALKFLPEMLLHERTLLEGLKTETRRSLELTHPHIVRIYDFIQDAQASCISMEYVDGETLSYLRARKESQVFEPAEIEAYIRDICEALEYAHEKARIVHRDLKPSNLMVNSRDEVKIADFGIARSLSDSVSMMTMSQHTSGTLVYMSPQQLEGERTSPLDDVYSLGAVLYELLTSKPPFFRGQVDHQIRTREPASIAERRAEFGIIAGPVPVAWQKTIAACLAKNPAERPQSARQVAEQLSSAAAAEFLPPTLVAHPVNRDRGPGDPPVPPGGDLGPVPAGVATTRAPSGKPWIFAGIAALIFLLLGIVLLYALFSGKESEPVAAAAETRAASPPPQGETVPGKIIVNTIPADAMVYLDGNNRGRSPVIIEDVPPGTHHLSIEAAGFEPTTLIADVKSGGTVDFGTMHLRAKAAASATSPPAVGSAPVAALPSPTLAPAPTASRDLAGEVRQFVLNHLRKWVNADISGQLADYAERVDYYENGMVDRSFIARDRQTYASSWPSLNLVPHGDIRLREMSTDQVAVYFDFRFEARNSKGIKSTGDTSNTWILDISSSNFRIVSEKQTVTNRKRSR